MSGAEEQGRFAALCEEEARRTDPEQPMGIGQYAEKRLHRICKRFFAEETADFEVRVGPYVADVKAGNHITEIQCGSFRPLQTKLAYYTEQGFSVTVVHPMAAELRLIRADRESGEVLRSRRYRQYRRPVELMAKLYELRDLPIDGRIQIKLLLYEGEELRYSERVRYRKSGAYESEHYPKALIDVMTFEKPSDYLALLPEALPSEFDAAEAGALLRLQGRKLYSALNAWVSLGILSREKRGRSFRYRRAALDACPPS